MRKITILAIFIFGSLTLHLTGASTNTSKGKPVNQQEENEKYDILRRDQIDNSNTLAIPFDDSEIEDEEEINRDEKKEVFPLPTYR